MGAESKRKKQWAHLAYASFSLLFIRDGFGSKKGNARIVAATNEFAVEVLEAMVEMFDAKIQCHGPHSKLLKEISMRVKVLQRMREYLEGIFGKVNEGHQFVDEFRLAKIRYVRFLSSPYPKRATF